MKNFLKIFSIITFSLLLFSCEEKYEDTKDAGKTYLSIHAKKNTETLKYIKKNDDGSETEITVDAPIKILHDGLQYAFYYENSYGEFPRTDIITYVVLNYKGYFINNIDSFDEGTNKVMLYSNLIYGLQEVIGKMRIGSKCRVWIPQELAYGEDGSTNIDPYSALIFDIELINAF